MKEYSVEIVLFKEEVYPVLISPILSKDLGLKRLYEYSVWNEPLKGLFLSEKHPKIIKGVVLVADERKPLEGDKGRKYIFEAKMDSYISPHIYVQALEGSVLNLSDYTIANNRFSFSAAMCRLPYEWELRTYLKAIAV